MIIDIQFLLNWWFS